MAWRSHGETNLEMLDNLRKNELIKSDRVYEAMRKVDRGHFAPYSPYRDAPQSIGHGVTISAPHMHANAAQALEQHLQPGMSALDVGSGSGYLLAVFAHMVQPEGKVVGIEYIPELVEKSKDNLRKDPTHAEMLKDGRIMIIGGDGSLGWPEGAPYDAIHVGAAAPRMPTHLIDQLRPGTGKMFIPVGQYEQAIWEVTKDADGTVHKSKMYDVRYVPLHMQPEN
ncbi:protein-L-isoaspartate O-methyltransferas-like protein [Saitoella complicata NRRL Y-17804]|nr:protein-L-isoaspartate O-methyltransferas-like protein [Saitoella complicata NRRL Y-17804]ODQ51427.1 protein-L-isoaspartate O-methyltransferas-like protein [Saitoella complicata NRRL Y-17804]